MLSRKPPPTYVEIVKKLLGEAEMHLLHSSAELEIARANHNVYVERVARLRKEILDHVDT